MTRASESENSSKGGGRDPFVQPPKGRHPYSDLGLGLGLEPGSPGRGSLRLVGNVHRLHRLHAVYLCVPQPTRAGWVWLKTSEREKKKGTTKTKKVWGRYGNEE